MLSLMRENAGSWIIKILLAVVVLVFIFLGIGPDRRGDQNVAAEVNKTVITVDDFKMAYNNVLQAYRNQFGDNLNDEFIKMLNLKANTLESLIDRQLILEEADRFGIQATDDEVRNLIRGITVFQENGRFDPDRYSSYIRYSRQTPEYFEAMQRRDLVIKKFQGLISDTVPVSDDEIRAFYVWEKTGVRVGHVRFDSDAIEGIAPTDDEILAFYEKQADNYRSEPQVRARYLCFDPDDYRASVTVSDDEITAFYTANQEKYDRPKTVSARHILIRVDENAPEETVEEKRLAALNVYNMAVKGGQDFAELARTYSEDSSKDQGGALGTFDRNRMVQPFSDKAFSMKAGDISEPVRTRFGWHVIKVEAVNEARRQPLDEVRAEIETRLARQKAENQAYDQVDLIYDAVLSGSTMDQAAQTASLPLINSGLFTETAGPAGVDAAVRSRFTKAAFELAENGISDILDLDGRYYILQIAEKKGAEIQPLDAVKDRVAADLIRTMKDERAKGDAAALIAAVRDGKTTLADQAGYEETPVFTRDSRGTDAGIESAVVRAAFALSTETPLSAEPVNVTGGYAVIRLIDRTPPDQSVPAEEMERIRADLGRKKQAQALQRWVDQLKARSTVKRNEHLLD
ncbi:peptidylprolyl isomerase [Desulfatiferula olefinivorans]